MSEANGKPGLGWIPDYPDIRDRTEDHDRIRPVLQRIPGLSVKGTKSGPPTLAATADLRAWCPPIEDQGSLGSCTANAGVGVVEYFERRAFGRHIDASRLFLYKATRNLLHWKGDTGAYLRTTMKALVLFGVPPEEYWPYQIASFDTEPSAFCYAFGQSYQSIQYFRLDTPGTFRADLLIKIKTNVAAGLPAMFGFTVYQSYGQAAAAGAFPWPAPGEGVVGGHAVVAVGYDDKLTIKNTAPNGPTTKGAFLIRNSWGTGWGSSGYGWLPYEYVLKGQAVDWWCLIRNEWIDTGAF